MSKNILTSKNYGTFGEQIRMPLISESHKCIFVRVPKTASSTILMAGFPQSLAWVDYQIRDPLDEWGFWEIDYKRWHQDSNHLPLSTIRKLLEPTEIDNYFKFAFVRNPWAKVVSQYFWVREWIRRSRGPWRKDPINQTGPIIGGKKGLKADLQQLEAAYQAANIQNFESYVRHAWESWDRKYLITQTEMTEGCDFVGNLCTLQKDFDHVCDKLNVPRKTLPQKILSNKKATNSTKHKHYSEYYTDETQQLIGDLFADDLENFGFKYE